MSVGTKIDNIQNDSFPAVYNVYDICMGRNKSCTFASYIVLSSAIIHNKI